MLYIDEGAALTAAGTAAGIDACLHIVRRDHGVATAARVARRMVVAAHRDGGQAQFIEHPVPSGDMMDPIGAAMARVRANLDRSHAIDELARSSHLSVRQFSRRFRAATGMTPARWIVQQRIEASLPLLELDQRGIEAIADLVGFGSPAAYRKHFRDIMGVSPAAWRQHFGAGDPPGPGRSDAVPAGAH